MALDSRNRDTALLPQLFTTKELSDYLGLPVSTLYLWRSNGRGPRAIKIGKHLRYRAADVEAWLEQQTPEMRTPGLTGHEGVRGDDRGQSTAER